MQEVPDDILLFQFRQMEEPFLDILPVTGWKYFPKMLVTGQIAFLTVNFSLHMTSIAVDGVYRDKSSHSISDDGLDLLR
jgi:hypothetical protein